MHYVILFVKWFVLFSFGLFAAGATFYCSPLKRELKLALSAVIPLGILLPFFFISGWTLPMSITGPVALLFFGWYRSIKPKAEAPWQKEVALLPRVEIHGDTLTVRNIRNFQYRTGADFDARYYDKDFDLTQVRTADLFLCYWGTAVIAHTIMSFGFANGEQLAISIETRKEVGEEYSAIKGFFKTFELMYVLADEQDLIGLRVNQRNENVYLYRLKGTPEQTKMMLLDYMKKVHKLEKTPEFYNALSTNCTTSILPHLRAVLPQFKFNIALLANGYIDKWRYTSGIWGFDLPFEEFRRQSWINEKVRQAINLPHFSERIRDGLPSFR